MERDESRPYLFVLSARCLGWWDGC
jgi:hypothetical protein